MEVFNLYDKQQINTFFHAAVLENDIDKVKKYLSMGADIDSENIAGNRAVKVATLNGYIKLLELLVKDYGADVNAKDNKLELTPLHMAVFLNNLEIVKLLCNQTHIDLDVVDSNNDSAIFMACRNGNNVEFVKILIESGCNLKLRNNLGQTAMDAIIDVLMSNQDQELILKFEEMMKIN